MEVPILYKPALFVRDLRHDRVWTNISLELNCSYISEAYYNPVDGAFRRK